MENKIEFNSVKKQVNEYNELTGYLADGMSIPLAEGNRHYQMVKQWLADGNTAEPAYTPEEILANENQVKVSEAKTYLSSTDWIVIKINEAQVLGEDINPLLTEYTTELQERQSARDLINQLEVV